MHGLPNLKIRYQVCLISLAYGQSHINSVGLLVKQIFKAELYLKWMPKQKESTRKTEEKLDGRYKEGHERKKPK